MNIRTDLLSEVIENKVNVLSDQCKNIEVLQDNIKFLQMELKTKNEIIKNLLDTQSAIVESLSLAKQQNSQAALLAKQQTKTQDEPELHCTKLALNLNQLEKAFNSTSKTNIKRSFMMLTNIFKSKNINQGSN